MPADNERLRLPLTHKPMPLRVSAQLAVKGPQAAAPRGPRKRSRIASDSVGADYGTPSLPRAWQAVGRMKVIPGGPGAEQLAAVGADLLQPLLFRGELKTAKRACRRLWQRGAAKAEADPEDRPRGSRRGPAAAVAQRGRNHLAVQTN